MADARARLKRYPALRTAGVQDLPAAGTGVLNYPLFLRLLAGLNREMFDYGWIENARSGEVVWEMTYSMTFHAGGGRKNRMVNTTLYLDKGEYTLHYTSDDSHSFNDWNAEAKPMHPMGGGHWLKETALPPGTYEYCLVVDGQWLADPLARGAGVRSSAAVMAMRNNEHTPEARATSMVYAVVGGLRG